MEKYDWEQFCENINCPFWGTNQCCVDYCEGERDWEIDFYVDDDED